MEGGSVMGVLQHFASSITSPIEARLTQLQSCVDILAGDNPLALGRKTPPDQPKGTSSSIVCYFRVDYKVHPVGLGARLLKSECF